jgi:hypothetical protein
MSFADTLRNRAGAAGKPTRARDLAPGRGADDDDDDDDDDDARDDRVGDDRRGARADAIANPAAARRADRGVSTWRDVAGIDRDRGGGTRDDDESDAARPSTARFSTGALRRVERVRCADPDAAADAANGGEADADAADADAADAGGGARVRATLPMDWALKVRSIHWSPYDRVGVVNADP